MLSRRESVALNAVDEFWEFEYTPTFQAGPIVKSKFDLDGFIVLRKVFQEPEVQKLSRAVLEADDMNKYRAEIKDKEGRVSHQVTWNRPGSDVTGMAARCERMVETAEVLLGGEVYHYHSKALTSDPKIGGERSWKQDYGFWYQNGCIFPEMVTAYVALVKTDATNGGPQVLKGSHKCGRIDHTLTGAEAGADPGRVEHLKDKLELVKIGLKPGDVAFLHCNLLHYNGPNISNQRGVALLTVYNKASNNPVRTSHHPQYSPLAKVANDAVLMSDNTTNMADKDFLDMTNTETLRGQLNLKK